MYIATANHPDPNPNRSVMGAIDDKQYVIANLEQEDQWLSAELPVAVNLFEFR